MMKKITLLLLLATFSLACNKTSEENQNTGAETEIAFDREKWGLKEGKDYPYRDLMLNDVVYNDTIRSLNQTQILVLLGKPDRSTEDHLYYTISQTRLGFWPIHTKTMVIKFAGEDSIEWIKIHK